MFDIFVGSLYHERNSCISVGILSVVFGEERFAPVDL